MRTVINVQQIDAVKVEHYPPTESRSIEFWTVDIKDDDGNRVSLFINPNELIAKIESAVDAWQNSTDDGTDRTAS